MDFQRSNSHKVSRLTAHIVWSTKYRHAVLMGDIKIRCRTLLIQICEAEGLHTLKGVISKDHVHIHLEVSPITIYYSSDKTAEGSFLTQVTNGIPGIEEALLGSSFLGDRLWMLNRTAGRYWEYYR